MEGWKNAKLEQVFLEDEVSLFRLKADYKNRYYIVSDPKITKLLNSPEVIGYDVHKAMVPTTVKTLKYLDSQSLLHPLNIFNILRGALNFPMEESSYLGGLKVHNISFLSCERVFQGKEVTGLDARYSKLTTVDKGTLLIGDIIASGDTFTHCIKYVLQHYKQNDVSLKNIVYFTIGGKRGIELAENLTDEIRKFWPNFEGIIGIFYGGIFDCYETKGVIGFQRPMIDFYWGDGIVDPYYRRTTLEATDRIFEKCIIYDGGARRFEIDEHIAEVTEYWEGILEKANEINLFELLAERLGHQLDISYEDWVKSNHYDLLDEKLLRELYNEEKQFIKNLEVSGVTLEQIAKRRLSEFNDALSIYMKRD